MKLRQIAPVAVLAIAALLAGCTGQSSDNSDDSSTSSPSARPTSDAVVDTFFGLKLELPADKWTTLVSGKDGTFAQVVYDDRSDCVSQSCPTLLIHKFSDPEYKTRVVTTDLMTDDQCEGGVSAFRPPVFKRAVQIDGMTARYYESGPCPKTNPDWMRRTWLLPGKMLIDEQPGADGRLARSVFDKLLEGAVKTS
jgi:hypothetical protein